MKVVINRCYGGFRLSEEALNEYKRRANVTENSFHQWDIMRNDPILVEIVEEMGMKANTRVSELKVVEIPDEVEWQIEEYDGLEWIAEVHRVWS